MRPRVFLGQADLTPGTKSHWRRTYAAPLPSPMGAQSFAAFSKTPATWAVGSPGARAQGRHAHMIRKQEPPRAPVAVFAVSRHMFVSNTK